MLQKRSLVTFRAQTKHRPPSFRAQRFGLRRVLVALSAGAGADSRVQPGVGDTGGRVWESHTGAVRSDCGAGTHRSPKRLRLEKGKRPREVRLRLRKPSVANIFRRHLKNILRHPQTR